MQRAPTSRKSGSNAPYRPNHFEVGRWRPTLPTPLDGMDTGYLLADLFVLPWADSRGGISHQSALIPANFTTLAHFSVSSAISLPTSAGDPGSATPPRSARRAFILGSARAVSTSLLSLSTISAGVFVGTPRPYH